MSHLALASVEHYGVAVTPEVKEWLQTGAVCALGVSGGKDSQAMAIRLAEYLGWELIVLRRAAGDMMDRWETRWANNLARYASLSCVKLILPWSTPGMRFCTSELKTDLICRALTKRFPGQKILSATGVRADESAKRAKMPIASPQSKLSARGCQGMNWNPILQWPTPSVFDYIALKQEQLHEAYTVYGSSRVSCAFCIMGSCGDLLASASCPDNAGIYRRMVRLEIASTFALQETTWLGDVAPHLLSAEERDGLAEAKRRAALRVEAEARLPVHLLYTSGWPTCIPSKAEASLIAEVRSSVSSALGIAIDYTTGPEILDRYRALYEQQRAKQQTPAPKKRAKVPYNQDVARRAA